MGGFNSSPKPLPNLNVLNISCTDLWDLTVLQLTFLEQMLSQLLNLRELSMAGNRLNKFTAVQWTALGQALNRCPNLRALNLSNNGLDDFTAVQWIALGQLLHHSKSCELTLTNNDLHNMSENKRQALLTQGVQFLQLSKIFLSAKEVERMSVAQLDTWALIAPNAIFIALNAARNSVAIEKLSYLQSKSGCARVVASACLLYRATIEPIANSGVAQSSVSSVVTRALLLPEAVTHYIASFLSHGSFIDSGIRALCRAKEVHTLSI